MFNDASFINKVACIIEDIPEKERIIQSIIVAIFSLIFEESICSDGIENSINPSKKYVELLVIILSIILQGIEKITMIPKIFIKVLKAYAMVSFSVFINTRLVNLF